MGQVRHGAGGLRWPYQGFNSSQELGRSPMCSVTMLCMLPSALNVQHVSLLETVGSRLQSRKMKRAARNCPPTTTLPEKSASQLGTRPRYLCKEINSRIHRLLSAEVAHLAHVSPITLQRGRAAAVQGYGFSTAVLQRQWCLARDGSNSNLREHRSRGIERAGERFEFSAELTNICCKQFGQIWVRGVLHAATSWMYVRSSTRRAVS